MAHQIFDITYTLPYILLFALFLILYRFESNQKNEIKKRNIQLIGLAVLIFFIGFSGFMNTDFMIYYPSFKKLHTITHLKPIDFLMHEPGFVIYSSLLKTIWPNYDFFVFISTTIDLVILFFFFRKYTNSVSLAFLFFIVFYGLQFEFDLFRNVKALDCFLLSFPFLIKRRFVPFLLWNLLGFTFHSSALIYLPCYFVLMRRFPLKPIVWTMIAFNIIYFLDGFKVVSFLYDTVITIGIDERISTKLSGYIKNSETSAFTVFHLQRTAFIIITLCVYSKLCRQKPSNIPLLNCFFIYYLSLMFFSEVTVFIQRIPLLFVLGEWCVMANLFSIKFYQNKIVYAGILAISFLCTVLENRTILRYYDNVLFEHQDFKQRSANVIRYQTEVRNLRKSKK